ncbi:hypothetical protein ACFQ2K_47755 [Streptomyces sanglieri]|uniref:Uncharacterized protein n=1 Tax=Streptomyces sanglieri TaxID=193460 RepID=A0ABW2X6Q3_9ACTN
MLIQPIGGPWNPRADFEQTVLAHAPSITPDQFAAAISTGDHFFATSSSTPDYDDYHRGMLHHLGVPRPRNSSPTCAAKYPRACFWRRTRTSRRPWRS